jgi:DNA-binding transcriptional LysR family regulator
MTLPSSLLPELPVLLVIAEEGHFGRAAERLNVSQPRVSQVVRRIEDLVGYEIFYRRPRVRLTPPGELLVKAAQQALDDLDLGLARAEDAAAGRRGKVRLGFAPVAMLTELPRILKSFHERHPLVELQLHTTYSANLWYPFEARQYDLIVSREARDSSGVESHLFVRDGLVAVIPVGDILANRSELAIADLASRPFVATEEEVAPQWHHTITSLCRSSGFEPHVTQRTNDWGAVLALVASGLGVSIVSSTLAQVRFPGVVFVPLKGSENVGSFWISWHERSDDSAVKLLVSELLHRSANGAAAQAADFPR